MSIATNESLLKGTRGKIGNLISRSVNGKTVISRAPEPDRPQTEAQINNQNQFREASAFAQAAMGDPGIKAYFQREAEKRKLPNAYTAALSFKLKDLKTSVQQKNQQSEVNKVTGLSPESKHLEAGDIMNVEQVEQFKQLYSTMIDTLDAALAKISTVWRNIERLNADKTQKEVMQTALRLQIHETLSFIHLCSKINATEFKHPAPDFGHINAVVNKTE
jgi:hypothetical protein